MLSAKKSFVEGIMAGSEIYHIKAPDQSGRSQHIFIKPNNLKKPQLDKMLNEGAQIIDFAEYGSILASCHGRFPTSDVRKKMKEEYNFEC